jgi:hypothetical protein
VSYIPKAVMPIATCALCHGTGQQVIKGHTFNPALGHPVALVRCECVNAQVEDEKCRWRAAVTAEVACPTCASAAGTECFFDAFERLDGHGQIQDRRGDVHLSRANAYTALAFALANNPGQPDDRP